MDSRHHFVYQTGSFGLVAPNNWTENRNDGSTSHFLQTHRTDEYIELYDQEDEVRVRLYNNIAKRYDSVTSNWVEWPGSEGSWQ